MKFSPFSCPTQQRLTAPSSNGFTISPTQPAFVLLTQPKPPHEETTTTHPQMPSRPSSQELRRPAIPGPSLSAHAPVLDPLAPLLEIANIIPKPQLQDNQF